MNYRRKKLLVEHKIQFAVVLRLAMHMTLFLVIWGALSLVVRAMISSFIDATHDGSAPAWVELVSLVTVFLAMLPYLIWDLLQLSNRFTGPVHRLHKVICALSEGESPGPVVFRKGDFWQGLDADFNLMVARLKGGDGEEATEPAIDEQVVRNVTEADGDRHEHASLSS